MSCGGHGNRILTPLPLPDSGPSETAASGRTGTGRMTVTVVLVACLLSAVLTSVPGRVFAATGKMNSASEEASAAAGARGSAPAIPSTDPGEGAPLPHDLHVTYGNLGVEGATAILQVRVFKNDLEEALQRLSPGEVVHLEVSPDVDALFLRYLSRSFRIEVGGTVLDGRIVGSGDDELDREPVWWYQIEYTAPAPITAARVTNTLLFEIFDDQRNVLRVVKFPQESRQAFYFAPGEETAEIAF